MIRSTTAANTRAIDKILLGRKPVEVCGCDNSSDLQRRIDVARPFIVAVIEEMVEAGCAGDLVMGLRKALSALDVGDG